MAPTLETIQSPLTPKRYVESLSEYELYELSCEIDQKDYYCQCLVGLEPMKDVELETHLKVLSKRVFLLEDRDKRIITFLLDRYI
jgi:hypothetical protein